MAWHYSKAMPSGKLIKIGVWEDSKFIGVVLFGRGAARGIGGPFGLKQTEICELVRVALDTHVTPVSRVIAIALRMLRKANPGLKMVISYADSAKGHHGGIYKAGGWVYIGESVRPWFKIHGKMTHPKTLYSTHGRPGNRLHWLRAFVDPNAEQIMMPPKHKYVMVFDPSLHLMIEEMRLPYPVRAESIDADAPDHQSGEGASQATSALHS